MFDWKLISVGCLAGLVGQLASPEWNTGQENILPFLLVVFGRSNDRPFGAHTNLKFEG